MPKMTKFKTIKRISQSGHHCLTSFLIVAIPPAAIIPLHATAPGGAGAASLGGFAPGEESRGLTGSADTTRKLRFGSYRKMAACSRMF
jgi:hypothetical protein